MDRLAASPATVVVVLHELEDTWTEVGWERLAAADPDVIYFVDYPRSDAPAEGRHPQGNPASRNLTAFEEERFVNLPYAMWVSGPLNIDAAEWSASPSSTSGLHPPRRSRRHSTSPNWPGCPATPG